MPSGTSPVASGTRRVRTPGPATQTGPGAATLVGNKNAMQVAERRFRPQFLVAFNAWLATHPFTNPQAPPGPTYMPQYVQPELAQANLLDARADNHYSVGETAANNSDGYIRTTVYLASVLFLVGISSHFRVRGPDGSHHRRRNHPGLLHRFADPGAETTALTRTKPPGMPVRSHTRW
jgi:hypothetical protein